MATFRPLPAPPGAWPAAHRAVATLTRPLERFLHAEAASSALLLTATLIALVWANSPFRGSYERLWRTPVTLGIGAFTTSAPVHFWINDGLMVVFFFVIGLEIRREIYQGELSEPRRAALPIAAALGGMLIPALLYFMVNHTSPAQVGWGVPMATDIAFAVGVLTLLGKRVPTALRVLLLAIAIIDDIGAILVIALFYSSGVDWSGVGLAALGVLGVVGLQSLGVRSPITYIVPGAVLWGGLLIAGVHPTIAGVILGLMTPARAWYGETGFVTEASAAVAQFRQRASGEHHARDLLVPLTRLSEARREAVPPIVRLEAALHPWVTYGIMPLFALANAGVDLTGVDLHDSASFGVISGVFVGLVLGKPVGVLAASVLTEQLGIASRPRGVTWAGVAIVGCVAGIGFTMAIFIAGLAFGEAGHHLGAAKLGVLLASTAAGFIALALGRALLPPAPARALEVTALAADETEAPAEN